MVGKFSTVPLEIDVEKQFFLNINKTSLFEAFRKHGNS